MASRKFIFFVLIFALLSSCEVDDICTETVLTPKLIVRFYDFSQQDTPKGVTNLYVWAEGKDSIYSNTTTDSIALPLHIASDNTKYLFSKNGVIDTLNVTYNKQEIFVSRSCGFKYNFELTDALSLSNHWTQNLQTNTSPQIINNEAAAHLKIFH